MPSHVAVMITPPPLPLLRTCINVFVCVHVSNVNGHRDVSVFLSDCARMQIFVVMSMYEWGKRKERDGEMGGGHQGKNVLVCV